MQSTHWRRETYHPNTTKAAQIWGGTIFHIMAWNSNLCSGLELINNHDQVYQGLTWCMKCKRWWAANRTYRHPDANHLPFRQFEHSCHNLLISNSARDGNLHKPYVGAIQKGEEVFFCVSWIGSLAQDRIAGTPLTQSHHQRNYVEVKLPNDSALHFYVDNRHFICRWICFSKAGSLKILLAPNPLPWTVVILFKRIIWRKRCIWLRHSRTTVGRMKQAHPGKRGEQTDVEKGADKGNNPDVE